MGGLVPCLFYVSKRGAGVGGLGCASWKGGRGGIGEREWAGWDVRVGKEVGEGWGDLFRVFFM